jgi:hypothetical protein
LLQQAADALSHTRKEIAFGNSRRGRSPETVAHQQKITRRIEAIYKHVAQKWRAGAEETVVTALIETLQEMTFACRIAVSTIECYREEVAACQAQQQALETDLATAQVRIEALEAELARRPVTAQVEIPARTVTLRSAVDRELMRLLAVEGLARSWRLISRVVEAGLTENENTVRNALRRLKQRDLIENYTWNNRVQVWSPTPGGGRQLVRLTETGRYWAEQAYQVEALPCEIDAMAARHRGVSHAIGILEARDHLRAAGYTVDDAPPALLEDEEEPWGRRSEPDLVATLEEEWYPVEVQREVADRNDAKWGRYLEADQKLLLVLFSEHMREKQMDILERAFRWNYLPEGVILLTSLEALEAGKLDRWELRS